MTIKNLLMPAVVGALAACSVSATGPRFSEQPIQVAPQGYVRAYIFRDKVFYIAQAPHVQSAQISIDEHSVGSLPNGSYLIANVSAGCHLLTVGAGDYQTSRYFDARASGSGFIEITDKTRMEGTRIAGEAATGAVAAMGDSAQDVGGTKSLRYAAISGAITNALQDEAFSGSPERVWGISFPLAVDATRRLQPLLASVP